MLGLVGLLCSFSVGSRTSGGRLLISLDAPTWDTRPCGDFDTIQAHSYGPGHRSSSWQPSQTLVGYHSTRLLRPPLKVTSCRSTLFRDEIASQWREGVTRRV